MHYWSTLITLAYVGGHYATKLLHYRAAWKKLAGTAVASPLPGISVVVAFRNEEHNLPTLLAHLAKQRYAAEVEFILVNDHSTDRGSSLVRHMAMRDGRFKLLENDAASLGKKAAIATGVRSAKHEWIVTTDADTWMHEAWLSSMSSHMHEDVHLVCGPVIIESQSLFGKMQSLEMCVLNTLTGASIQQHAPLMCSGANLAFRKETYLDLRPHPEDSFHLSGDDVFLLQRMLLGEKKIAYCNQSHACVKTRAAGWKQFWAQRVRWAQKTKAVHNEAANQFGLLLFATNMVALWSMVGFFLADVWPLCVGFWGIKMAAETLLLMPAVLRFERTKDLVALPLLVVFYPFYTMGIGILSIGWRPKWKGRDLSLEKK